MAMGTLSPYSPPITINSQIYTNLGQHKEVPSIDHLVELEAELKAILPRKVHESKKAAADGKALDSKWKKIKEREKAKSKNTIKLKREVSEQLAPELMSSQSQPWLSTSASTTRPAPPTSKTAPSAVPTSATAGTVQPLSAVRAAGNIPRSTPVDNKKKKRKRDTFEDDPDVMEVDSQRSRVLSNVSPSSVPPVKKEKSKSKLPKEYIGNDKLRVEATAKGYGVASDFNLPTRAFLPQRPPRNPIPIPGPNDPSEVNEDFSLRKRPTEASQVSHTVFWNSVEPYIRPLREEDVAFLAFTGDDVDPFIFPALGRHYTEVWAEEDAFAAGEQYVPPANNGGRGNAASSSTSKWNPANLGESDCITDLRGHGAITERLLSALLLDPTAKVGEGDLPPGNGVGNTATISVGDLEERVRSELRTQGLLPEGEEVNLKNDFDEIGSELRRCQRLLGSQMRINSARKARILELAQHHLARNDYTEARDAMEKKLAAGFAKMCKIGTQRPAKGKNPKSKKDRNNQSDSHTLVNGVGPDGLQGPQGLPGMGLIGTSGQLEVPDDLKRLVKARSEWIEALGPAFRNAPLPKESIFKDLDIEGLSKAKVDRSVRKVDRDGDTQMEMK